MKKKIIKKKIDSNKQVKNIKEMKKEKDEIINKEVEEEEEENDNENNFYNKYDEYYSEQPLLLKKSNPKAKYNQIDLNNFYPKLKHIKEKSKNLNKENDNVDE